MSKEKKTSADLMAEFIFDNIDNCLDCPGDSLCDVDPGDTTKKELCINKIKQHFDNKATAQDGWDVVKNILCTINEYFFVTMETREDQYKLLEKIILDAVKDANIDISDIAERYEINVDNQSK